MCIESRWRSLSVEFEAVEPGVADSDTWIFNAPTRSWEWRKKKKRTSKGTSSATIYYRLSVVGQWKSNARRTRVLPPAISRSNCCRDSSSRLNRSPSHERRFCPGNFRRCPLSTWLMDLSARFSIIPSKNEAVFFALIDGLSVVFLPTILGELFRPRPRIIDRLKFQFIFLRKFSWIRLKLWPNVPMKKWNDRCRMTKRNHKLHNARMLRPTCSTCDRGSCCTRSIARTCRL